MTLNERGELYRSPTTKAYSAVCELGIIKEMMNLVEDNVKT